MNFKAHSDLKGEHSFLSPSKYSWIHYDEERLSSSYLKYLALQKGVDLHDLACKLIRMGVKLPKSKKPLNQYVNDAIGFRMIPEQILYYSDNSFGTTDAISFRDDFLRIHDLKTGVSPVSIHQLEIYASLFCLEYSAKPTEISIEFRIYQTDEILIHVPEPYYIEEIMEKIIAFDKKIDQLKEQEELSWLRN
jgi:hypothetical protein